jgi:hypothetical protein
MPGSRVNNSSSGEQIADDLSVNVGGPEVARPTTRSSSLPPAGDEGCRGE